MLLAAGLCFLPGKFTHLLLGVPELPLEPLVLLLLAVLSCSALVPFLGQLLHVLLEPIGQSLGEQVEMKQQVCCQPGREYWQEAWPSSCPTTQPWLRDAHVSLLLTSSHLYPIPFVFLCVGAHVYRPEVSLDYSLGNPSCPLRCGPLL